MHIPLKYRWNDPIEIKEFLKLNNHGLFISSHDGISETTILPFEFLFDDDDKLLGALTHISKANKHSKLLKEGQSCTIQILHIPTYISSSWYKNENVSTLNYISVKGNGMLHIQPMEELIHSLKNLTNHYESSSENGRTFESLSEKLISDHLPGIIGLEIRFTETFAAKKLSQNRDDEDFKNIVTHLEAQGEQEMAKSMKAIRPQLFQ
jgi:transcriptional regulator